MTIRLLDLDDSYETDPDVDRWWSAKAPALSAIARRWWDVMKGCGADVRETLHNGYPAACLDVYPFAYVDAFTKHVNVGFYYGAFLPDPDGILVGSGKRMRHVKLFPGEDCPADALREMIRRSYLDMRQRLGRVMPNDAPPALGQINIVVRDMRKALAFYRLLGVQLQEIPDPAWSAHHASGVTANGVRVELDSVAFAKHWNPALDERRLGSATMPFFHVATREQVDRAHERVTAAGFRSQKAPEDAFWGARYAIVEDPDGNAVGVMSPVDDSMRRPPPPRPRG